VGAVVAGIGFLSGLNDRIATVFRVVALVLVAAMTGSILLQVLFRYVLNRPIGWTEEFSIYSMIWMTFLVAPIAYRQGLNVAIEVLLDQLRPRGRAVVELLLTLLVLVLLVALLYFAIIYSQRGLGSLAASLPVRMFWIYVSMPLGMAAMLLVGLELLLRNVARLADPDRPLPAMRSPAAATLPD
jgi:TRAP-type C4-dicarboxylate transport system permease small subunit